MATPDSSWKEYQQLVLSELKRLDSDIQQLERHLTKVQMDLVELKVRAGLWGMVGAAIPVIAWALINKWSAAP